MKFGEKIKNFFSVKNKNISGELLDELCDLLIEGDFGASEAYKTAELLKADNYSGGAYDRLYEILLENLNKAKTAVYPQKEDKLTIILLLGVNGAGKTTTAAKLCAFYEALYGKKTIFAAADTFRAAAIDQLKIHGEKLGARVIAHKQGGDPAAVIYDALEAAEASASDLVIADTAGRMHTKSALMEELRKIDRVAETKAGKRDGVKYLKYLVLDATTGRNAFAQAEVFNDAAPLDGAILTKHDSTAKGGIVFSLARELNLPVAFICSGEKYSDIEVFDPVKFTKEFTGIE